MDKKLNAEAVRVIEYLGGTCAAAKLMDVKPPSISQWKYKGIPKVQLRLLKLMRPKAFKTPPKESALPSAQA